MNYNIDMKINNPLQFKGTFNDNFLPTYDYRSFDYIKIGNKNQLLGAGAFGEVFLAKHRIENKKYAIKVLNKGKLIKNNVSFSIINKEIELHSKLDHPYIISMKCHHETKDSFYIVMDYSKNGSLYSKLNKMKNGFSEESAFKYFIQTCSAIYFLHINNLAHRDIKPENLLLDDNNNIKLSDFGWCDYYNNRRFNEKCGTLEYMAPEIINDLSYDEKVDSWALGVLLYELLHGKSPFFIENLYLNTNTQRDLLKKINENQISFKEELSDSVKDLILRLLNKNVNDRYSVGDIFNHPWVTSKKVDFRSTKRINTVYLKPHELKLERNGILLEESSPNKMNISEKESGHRLFFSPVKKRSRKVIKETNEENEDEESDDEFMLDNKDYAGYKQKRNENKGNISKDNQLNINLSILNMNSEFPNMSNKTGKINTHQIFKLYNINDHSEVYIDNSNNILNDENVKEQEEVIKEKSDKYNQNDENRKSNNSKFTFTETETDYIRNLKFNDTTENLYTIDFKNSYIQEDNQTLAFVSNRNSDIKQSQIQNEKEKENENDNENKQKSVLFKGKQLNFNSNIQNKEKENKIHIIDNNVKSHKASNSSLFNENSKFNSNSKVISTRESIGIDRISTNDNSVLDLKSYKKESKLESLKEEPYANKKMNAQLKCILDIENIESHRGDEKKKIVLYSPSKTRPTKNSVFITNSNLNKDENKTSIIKKNPLRMRKHKSLYFENNNLFEMDEINFKESIIESIKPNESFIDCSIYNANLTEANYDGRLSIYKLKKRSTLIVPPE